MKDYDDYDYSDDREDYRDDYDDYNDNGYDGYDDDYSDGYDSGAYRRQPEYDAPRNDIRRGSTRNRLRDDRYDDEFEERYAPRTGGMRRPAARHDRQYYSGREDEQRYDNSYTESHATQKNMNKPESFRRRHPVLMNLIYIIAASAMMIWMMLWFLDFWTFHGEERVVPDVKGQPFASAEGNVDLSGLKAVISDSVFDSYSRPGTVVEQTPIAGARIKKGGTVYLTVVAFTPKLITVPDFYNVSVRQARSMFNGLGINEIREVSVLSEYQGLVLGARFNGVALQPGARIPVSAIVTLEVGSGMGDTTETDDVTDTLVIDETIEELNIE